MTIAISLALAYLAAGITVALVWRYSHGPLHPGQWSLLILGWPLVLLVIYAADREGWPG